LARAAKRTGAQNQAQPFAFRFIGSEGAIIFWHFKFNSSAPYLPPAGRLTTQSRLTDKAQPSLIKQMALIMMTSSARALFIAQQQLADKADSIQI
jgi:hypothetical protein